MRGLVAVVFLLGCDGMISLSWSVTDLATDRRTICPAGATTARLSIRPLDEYITSHTNYAGGWSIGDPKRSSLSCRNGGAYITPRESDDDRDRGEDFDLGDGTEITIEFIGGDRVVSTSLPSYVPASHGGSVHVGMVEDGGYFTFDWFRRPRTVGDPGQARCMGEHGRLRISVEGVQGVDEQIVECDGLIPRVELLHPLFMATRAFPAGQYRVTIESLDETQQVVRTTTWEDLVLGMNNDVVYLP